MNRYYTMQVKENAADVYIFGDIIEPTSKEFFGVDADVSGYSLVQEIKGLTVSEIRVHIDSYGGHVSEGWAIYNELRNHPAEVTTITEGFAASAASIVFMAGEKRIMRQLSGLFIHEVQSIVQGNSDDKRKVADEDDAMTRISAQSYLEHVNIPETQLMDMMKRETWIWPDEAVEMGFATSVEDEEKTNRPTQSVRRNVFDMLANPPARFAAIEDKLDALLAQNAAAAPKDETPTPPEPPAQKYSFLKNIKEKKQ